MSRKQTSKPAAAPAKPAGNHGYIETVVDTLLMEAMANGHKLDVAKIATASLDGEASPTAKLIHERLTQLAAVVPALAHSLKRVNKDVKYTMGRETAIGRNANGVIVYRPRSPRSEASKQAVADIAAAIAGSKPAARKRGRKS